ncbi:eukaryotic translation elongation factor 1 epsilon-1-like [Argiope bruennichi]|uniref:eukaryotic translation elongation factor 1 epsilon-1-like n=1 Tax=Argiope bruennichi TaxID=94029 RepID=UPI0024956685|nr:eukaryotic translation elongation factor 1 epsilon-1-like [Argiope bruennichi]
MDPTKILMDAGRILKINNSFFTTRSKPEDIKLKTDDGQVINCFIPAVLYIGQASCRNGFIGSTKEEQASVYQWLEYCLLKSQSPSNEILKELNAFLQDKVYFVGNKFTVVDLIMYLSLQEIYSKMTFQDKELYSNLSRWFRLVQNDACLQKLYPKICFAKTKLYS